MMALPKHGSALQFLRHRDSLCKYIRLQEERIECRRLEAEPGKARPKLARVLRHKAGRRWQSPSPVMIETLTQEFANILHCKAKPLSLDRKERPSSALRLPRPLRAPRRASIQPHPRAASTPVLDFTGW
jgi:hypothetical protein